MIGRAMRGATGLAPNTRGAGRLRLGCVEHAPVLSCDHLVGTPVHVDGGSYTDVTRRELAGLVAEKSFPLINVHIPLDGMMARSRRPTRLFHSTRSRSVSTPYLVTKGLGSSSPAGAAR